MAGIDRLGALDKAFEFIYKSETDGDYCEFGVYQGVSLIRALRTDHKWHEKTNRCHVKRFFGFDSFSGLPPFSPNDRLEGYEVFKEGQFGDASLELVRQKIKEEKLEFKEVKLIPGLFSETLTSPGVLGEFQNSSVAIAHIDCDLYSSALDCLKFLDGRLSDGAVLLFDDWFCFRGRPDYGVRAAFERWVEEGVYWITDYFFYSWAGKAFIVNVKNS